MSSPPNSVGVDRPIYQPVRPRPAKQVSGGERAEPQPILLDILGLESSFFPCLFSFPLRESETHAKVPKRESYVPSNTSFRAVSLSTAQPDLSLRKRSSISLIRHGFFRLSPPRCKAAKLKSRLTNKLMLLIASKKSIRGPQAN